MGIESRSSSGTDPQCGTETFIMTGLLIVWALGVH
jgi:hypothetical protein